MFAILYVILNAATMAMVEIRTKEGCLSLRWDGSLAGTLTQDAHKTFSF